MNKFSVMRLIGDHMVFQSDMPNRVSGIAPASSEVVLSVSDGTMTDEIGRTLADDKGVWSLTIPPFPASFREHTLVFTCGDDTITVKDVLFGELFHISGQSNMELPVSRTIDPLDVQIPPDNAYIREFRVPVQCSFGMDEEYDDFQGGCWKAAVGEDIMNMSATGYWFADELFRKMNVPVGLVNTSAGGAPVESRLPYKTLMRLGGYDEFLYQCTVPDYQKKTAAADAEKYRRWNSILEKQDTISEKIFTEDPEYRKCTIPFYFRDVPELDGMCGRVWFRKKFTIPDTLSIDDAVLILGTMIDSDKVYVNGEYVGETGYMYPPRIYSVPSSLLHHGENTIHVRLEVRTGTGGFVKDKKYCLKLDNELIDLSGEWEYAIAAKADMLPPDVFFQGLPLSMYGAMTAPAFGIRFRGMLWYQGESNDRAPERYLTLFREFVDMYRERCGYEIPVIITQLTNFDDPTCAVPENAWAEIREQQKRSLDIPNTAMAVTIGIGESNDLHPRNKRDVGKRLAYCAERLIYGDTTAPADVYPTAAEMTDDGIHVRFDGKVTTEDELTYFDILGKDGATPAKAVLREDGVKVVCSNRPQFVRYAWRNDPAEPELFSSYGLPLSPFSVRVKDSISVRETMLDDEIYIMESFPVHDCENGAVILCHGYNQNTGCTGDMAKALAEAGYRTYAFDFRGGAAVSKSKGSGTKMSIATEIADLERVIEYVKGFSPERLYLYGESQGGFVSALTAADRTDIDGLALEYPAFCIPDQWLKKDPEDIPDSFDFMGHVISREYFYGVPRYDVYEKISHFTGPVLIMQGTADRVVNEGYAHKVKDSYKNASLILYQGEDHGFSPAARDKQKNDMIAFLDGTALSDADKTEYNDEYYRQLSLYEGCN